MMKPIKRNQRLALLGVGGVTLFTAAALILSALNQNIALFYSPIQIVNGEADLSSRIRLGGLVAAGTVMRGEGIETIFDVTDGAATVTVRYEGILPDLFREGQGVVAQGSFIENNVFKADTILAKHDENYKPKELQEALEEASGGAHPKETSNE